MCVAVYKPLGQKMPSKKIFSNCFSNNPDGAGFMFPANGKVHVEKGFMSFSAFKKGLKTAIKKYGITPKQTPMVFHFRITSQGGVKPSLTHPFPLTRDFDEMRKLSGDYDVACVHNGIIDFASSYKAVDYNDTMEFIKEVAFPLINKNKCYYNNKALMGILKYLLSGNRFAIMDSSGHVELIGDWKTEDGIYYSNSSYSYKYVSGFKTTKIAGDLKPYSTYSLFNDYEDDDWDIYITKDMEKEFLEKDVIHCPSGDGEEMIIEYIYHLDAMYAVCPDCGLQYKLSSKAESHAWEKGLCICDDYGDDDCYDDDYYKDFAYGKGVK